MTSSKLPRPGVRELAMVAVLLIGLVAFALVADGHYPIEKWLFWHYASYWLYSLVWALGCTGVGALSVRRLLGARLPLLELVALAFPLGMLEFELAMFVAGLFGLYQRWLFAALPLAFVLPALTELERLWQVAHGCFRRAPARRDPLVLLGAVFGLFTIGGIYFLVLSPDNVQFDARWKHLALAEDFVAHGGLRRLGEGWSFGARPHLTSYLYAWAFLLPKSRLFDRIELCAHLEFVAFLITTWVGIPAVVRRLVPRADPRLVWCSRFLFPGVLLYDSSLSVGADHFGAVFGPALFLVTLRAWRGLSPRACALLGTLLAATLMIKETVALLLVPIPVIAIAFRAGLLAWRARGKLDDRALRNWLLGPVAATLAVLIVSSPLWLKNWVWYGDPAYPLLHEYLTPRPWTAESAYRMRWAYEEANVWHPPHNLEGVWRTLKVLVTFSFVPNDWGSFHGKVPVFGSLFTLLVPCLLVSRAGPRLWSLVVSIHVAIAAWYWVHHQDRYLQALMPLMAAATAALMIHVWRAGWAARAALGCLVAFQVVWGGDVYFFQTHAIAHSVPKRVIDLISSGFTKDYEERFDAQGDQQALARLLPPHARVVLHDQSAHLGVEAESVSDVFPFQYGISYGSERTPRDVYELYRGLGVTHVFWQPGRSRGFDSLAGDLMFFDFALRRTRNAKRMRWGWLADMPASPPSEPFNDSVVVLGCGRTYPSGVYRMSDLRVPIHGPKARDFPRRPPAPLPADWSKGLRALADFVAAEQPCSKQDKLLKASGYALAASRGRPGKTRGQLFDLWIRVQ